MMTQSRMASIGYIVALVLLGALALVFLAGVIGIYPGSAQGAPPTGGTTGGSEYGPMGGMMGGDQMPGMGGMMGGGDQGATGMDQMMQGMGSGMEGLSPEEHRKLHDEMRKGMPEELREAMDRCHRTMEDLPSK